MPLPQEKPVRAREVSAWSGCDREQAVQRMFTAIARRYDLNNTLLSFGLHHRWKRVAAALVRTTTGGWALDVGAGTADLALSVARRAGEAGRVVAVDLNQAMLEEGARKIAREGLQARVACLRGTVEALGFRDSRFDAVTAGFCIRNVGNLARAFAEVRRMLKPGGQFVCLESPGPRAAGCAPCMIGTRSACCRGSARRSRGIQRASMSISRPRSARFPIRRP